MPKRKQEAGSGIAVMPLMTVLVIAVNPWLKAELGGAGNSMKAAPGLAALMEAAAPSSDRVRVEMKNPPRQRGAKNVHIAVTSSRRRNPVGVSRLGGVRGATEPYHEI